jgi:peptidyl-prolyl cis-trans isomerase A (cyclophilin A)
MKKLFIKSLFVFGMAAILPLFCNAASKETKSRMSASNNLFAKFDTTMGSFTVRLFPEDAPKTVENFVGLAKGTKEFTDPKTGAKTKRPYYDGLGFHRIIANFMIQGGDPRGDGTGGPGYTFADELQGPHRFTDKVGYLAMANAGPNTNGSQFFITVAKPGLPNAYTIFGEVVDGYDVVEKISKVKTDGNDRPLTPVVMNKVTIEEKAGK